MYKKVKIIGLQRSGTNWLSQLIKVNLDIDVYTDPLLPFFKHALPDESEIVIQSTNKSVITPVPAEYIADHPDELFIVIYKPRKAWLESIERKKVDLQQKRPFLFDNENNLVHEEAAKFYDNYMKAWLDLCQPNLLIVSYLDVLYNFSLFLLRLKKRQKIGAKRKKWVNINKVRHSKRFVCEDKEKYLKHSSYE